MKKSCSYSCNKVQDPIRGGLGVRDSIKGGGLGVRDPIEVGGLGVRDPIEGGGLGV